MGLLSGIAGFFKSGKAARKNVQAAQEFANRTKWDPFSINTGNLGISFNGSQASATLSPQLQALQNQLFAGAGGLLGGLGQTIGSGGITPFLSNEFNIANAMTPGSTAGMLRTGMEGVNPSLAGIPSGTGNIQTSLAGIPSSTANLSGMQGPQSFFNQGAFANLYGNTASAAQSALQGAMNPNQISTNIGDQFSQASLGMLGALGSFNPQDAASSYTNNLRAQALPEQQRAVNSTIQNLFNSGRLGSTGGANVLGRLAEAQNQQDLGFQLAGQQYGGQEQSRLAGLAQNFGMAGTGINQAFAQTNDALASGATNRALGLGGLLSGLEGQGFGQQFSTNQENFNRAQSINQMDFERAFGLNDAAFNRSLTTNQLDFERALGLNQEAFNRAFGLNQEQFNRSALQAGMLFDQNNLRAQQRFQNAMQLFGGGQQNIQSSLNAALGMLSGGQSIDANLLNAIQLGAGLGQMRSAVQGAAYSPLLEAQIGRNNASASRWLGLAGGLDNLLGL